MCSQLNVSATEELETVDAISKLSATIVTASALQSASSFFEYNFFN
jgi:hypothetical protein